MQMRLDSTGKYCMPKSTLASAVEKDAPGGKS